MSRAPLRSEGSGFTMLTRLNRQLRTGLWEAPAQWKALRRVAPWVYGHARVNRVSLPWEKYVQPLFKAFPVLRLETPSLSLGLLPSSAQTPVQANIGGIAKTLPNSKQPFVQVLAMEAHQLIQANRKDIQEKTETLKALQKEYNLAKLQNNQEAAALAEQRQKELTIPHHYSFIDVFTHLRTKYQQELETYQARLHAAYNEASDRYDKFVSLKAYEEARKYKDGKPSSLAHDLNSKLVRSLKIKSYDRRRIFAKKQVKQFTASYAKSRKRQLVVARARIYKDELDVTHQQKLLSHIISTHRRVTTAATIFKHRKANHLAPSNRLLAHLTKFMHTVHTQPAPAIVEPVEVDNDKKKAATDAEATSTKNFSLKQEYERFLIREGKWSSFRIARTQEPKQIDYNENALANWLARKDWVSKRFVRFMDNMVVENGAGLTDFIAYVLYTQIVVMKRSRMIRWAPYTLYINDKLFRAAYKLLNSTGGDGIVRGPLSSLKQFDTPGATTSTAAAADAAAGSASAEAVNNSKVAARASTLHVHLFRPSKLGWNVPLVHRRAARPFSLSQSIRHAKLLALVESHLARSPVVELGSDYEAPKGKQPHKRGEDDEGMRLSPFWQEMEDEGIPWQHQGEGWANALLAEQRYVDSLEYEEEIAFQQDEEEYKALLKVYKEQQEAASKNTKN